MAEFQNAMEVFKLLEKSNCRKCNEATCLAFAAAVFKGTRGLADCPQLAEDIIAQFGGDAAGGNDLDRAVDEAFARLQGKIAAVDLPAAAERLGGTFADGRLTVKTLGKDISIDQHGKFYTDIHVHSWVAVPILEYVLSGKGQAPSGNWIPLRELPGGKSWGQFFTHKCEKPLKKLADTYTELFEDMVYLFGGREVDGHFDSDISVVLRPLPKVPLLVCYWKPEDGLESDLHLFFDSTAEDNLTIEALYTLGTGLSVMFEKVALRHG